VTERRECKSPERAHQFLQFLDLGIEALQRRNLKQRLLDKCILTRSLLREKSETSPRTGSIPPGRSPRARPGREDNRSQGVDSQEDVGEEVYAQDVGWAQKDQREEDLPQGDYTQENGWTQKEIVELFQRCGIPAAIKVAGIATLCLGPISWRSTARNLFSALAIGR